MQIEPDHGDVRPFRQRRGLRRPQISASAWASRRSMANPAPRTGWRRVARRIGGKRGAQVVGAVVVGGERRGQAARGRWAAARRAGRTDAPARAAGTGSRRPAPTPDCRAGPAPGVAPSAPNSSGLPGRIAIFQKSSVMPRACSPAMTRSWSPTLAPPVVTSMSMPGDGVGHRGDGARACRPPPAARSASRPPARTSAASACEFEQTMPPGGIGSPGMAISSPVARMAMRGRRCTLSQGWLAAAASPTSRAVSRRPCGHHGVAGREVLAGAADVAGRAGTASFTRTVAVAAVASSCSRMVSAPAGTTLPVNRRTASPGPTLPSNGWPAGAAPMTRSVAPRSRRRRAGRSRPSRRRRPAAGSAARSRARR